MINTRDWRGVPQIARLEETSGQLEIELQRLRSTFQLDEHHMVLAISAALMSWEKKRQQAPTVKPKNGQRKTGAWRLFPYDNYYEKLF